MAKINVVSNGYVFMDVSSGRPMFISNKQCEWNGDKDCPTFCPSARVSTIKSDGSGDLREYVNHLFIKHGKIIYCKDCTHEMAGQTVDMVDITEDVL